MNALPFRSFSVNNQKYVARPASILFPCLNSRRQKELTGYLQKMCNLHGLAVAIYSYSSIPQLLFLLNNSNYDVIYLHEAILEECDDNMVYTLKRVAGFVPVFHFSSFPIYVGINNPIYNDSNIFLLDLPFSLGSFYFSLLLIFEQFESLVKAEWNHREEEKYGFRSLLTRSDMDITKPRNFGLVIPFYVGMVENPTQDVERRMIFHSSLTPPVSVLPPLCVNTLSAMQRELLAQKDNLCPLDTNCIPQDQINLVKRMREEGGHRRRPVIDRDIQYYAEASQYIKDQMKEMINTYKNSFTDQNVFQYYRFSNEKRIVKPSVTNHTILPKP